MTSSPPSECVTPTTTAPTSSLPTDTLDLSTSTSTPTLFDETAPASLDSKDTLQEHSATALYQSYHTQLENLKALPIPYSDIYHALSANSTIPVPTLVERFQKASTDLGVWLETAEMTVFGLEMDVVQEGASDKRDVGEIDVIFNRFQPNIDMLLELKERIESRLTAQEPIATEDDQRLAQNWRTELEEASNRISTSWSSLKKMLEKVKLDLVGTKMRSELLVQMDTILQDMTDICQGIDSFQSERQYTSCSSDDEARHHQGGNSNGGHSSADTLVQIDSKIELLTSRMDFLESRVRSLPADDAIGADNASKNLQRQQYQKVVDQWNLLKESRERLSDELKEDRWLVVFEQVAEQVESMMESMDRAIVHCKGLIDQIKSMVRERVIPNAPIDRDHLYTIFKSFEAKHTYYAPAVNKMLSMLESGIEGRMTRNVDVIRRHQTMHFKWEQMRGGLERVELELNGIDRLLDVLDDSIPDYLPTPPSQLPNKPLFSMRQSTTQGGWKSPNSPSQNQQQRQQQEQPRGRFQPAPLNLHQSPSSNGGRSRTRSPNAPPSRNRPWSPANSNNSASLSSVGSAMLSPNSLYSYRSISPGPSRSPTRGLADKLRPWCPSTKPDSPGIPGFPQVPNASTYRGRPVSSMGGLQFREDLMYMPSGGGPGSVVSTSSGSNSSAMMQQQQQRPGSRSGSTTPGSPSMIKPPAQYKPPFSPGGRSLSPGPGSRPSSSGSHHQSGANSRNQSPLPSPNHLSSTSSAAAARMRQRSAPGGAGVQSSGYGQQTNYASSSTKSSNYGQQQPPMTPQQRQRQSLTPTSQSTYAQQQQTAAQRARTPSSRSGTPNTYGGASSPANGYHSSGYASPRSNSAASPSPTPPGGGSGTASSRQRMASANGGVNKFGYNSPASPPPSNGRAGQSSTLKQSNAKSSLTPESDYYYYSNGNKRDSAYGSGPGSASSASAAAEAALYEDEYRSSRSSLMSKVESDRTRTASNTRTGAGPPTSNGRKERPLSDMMGDMRIELHDQAPYVPVRGDELDEEFARIVNASPIQMQIRRLGPGKYYFGGEDEDMMNHHHQQQQQKPFSVRGPTSGSATPTPGVTGGRMVLCRLMEYGRFSDEGHQEHASKVVVRIGGGWQDLDLFLLDHSGLAMPPVRYA